MQDKRAYERFSLEGTIELKQPEIDEPASAYLDNLSFGGFAMYSPQKIEIDKEVEFTLSTPLLDASLSGKGEVRYSNLSQRGPKGLYFMGVQFKEINQDMVLYLIKRIHLRLAEANRNKISSKNLSFMPY